MKYIIQSTFSYYPLPTDPHIIADFTGPVLPWMMVWEMCKTSTHSVMIWAVSQALQGKKKIKRKKKGKKKGATEHF